MSMLTNRPIVAVSLFLLGAVIVVPAAHVLAAAPDPAAAEKRSDDAVRQGNTARQAGRIDEAIAHYREALREQPERYEPRILLADTLRRAGRLAEAKKEYDAAVALDRSRPEGFAGQALLLRAAYDYDGAAAIITAALPLVGATGRPDLLLNLGETRRKQGRVEDAAVLFGRVLEARSGDPLVRAGMARVAEDRGDLKEALAQWDLYLEARPGDQAAGLRRRELLEIDASLRALRDAAERSPGPAVFTELGRLLSVAGDAAGATTAFRSALALDRESIDARRGLALALAARGDRPGAAAEFKEVLKRRPGDGVALYNLVALARADGNPAAEERAWKDLLAARPDDLYAARGFVGFLERRGPEALSRAAGSPPPPGPSVSGLRVMALIDAAAGRFSEAGEALYQALRADPTEPWTLEVANEVLSMQPTLLREIGGDAQAEAARLEQEGKGDDGALLPLMARLTLLAGRQSEALILARRAVAAAPGSAVAHSLLGELYQSVARDAVRALEELRLAAAGDSPRMTALADLSLALLRSGHPGEAEDVARKGLLARPGAAPLLSLLGASLADQGDLEGAAAAYAAALREDPADNFGLARGQYPLMLGALGRQVEARQALRGEVPPIPEMLYREAWAYARDSYRDRTFNGQDWMAWRDHYRGALEDPQAAYTAIAAMLASLGDPYSRLRDPEESAAVYLARRGGPARPDPLGRNPPSGQTVVTGDLPGGLGYIKISNLADPKVVAGIRAALAGMRDKDGIVLDLRGNTGGFTRSADAIGDLLAGPGKPAGVDVDGDGAITLVTGGEGAVTASPLVVLVDGQTGSAAERLARTLETSGRATLVGDPTHGKGLTQASRVLQGGMTVLVSAGEMLGADGRPLQGRGLRPRQRPAPAP